MSDTTRLQCKALLALAENRGRAGDTTVETDIKESISTIVSLERELSAMTKERDEQSRKIVRMMAEWNELHDKLLATQAECDKRDRQLLATALELRQCAEALEVSLLMMIEMNNGCYPLPYPESNTPKRKAFDLAKAALDQPITKEMLKK